LLVNVLIVAPDRVIYKYHALIYKSKFTSLF